MTCDRRASQRRAAWSVALGLCLFGSLDCSSRTEGLSVEVSVMHRLGHEAPLSDVAPQTAGTERGLVNDLGHGITLRRALVVIGSIELQACEQSWLERGLRALDPVPVAHAHGLGSPLELATPYVIDLMDDESRSLELARMAPPPGDYCGVKVEILPADVDAVGLPEDVDLVDSSVYVEGSLVPAGEASEVPFSLRSDVNDRAELAFVDEQGAPAVLTLTRETPMAEMRFDLRYGHMFDGVDTREEDADLSSFLLIRNLLQSARVVLP